MRTLSTLLRGKNEKAVSLFAKPKKTIWTLFNRLNKKFLKLHWSAPMIAIVAALGIQ